MGDEIFMKLEKLAEFFCEKGRPMDAAAVYETMTEIDRNLNEGTKPITVDILEKVKRYVALAGDIAASGE